MLRGVRLWRAPLWVPERPSGMKRLVHLASFAAASLPWLIAHALWRPDVVMTIAPSLLNAPARASRSAVSRARVPGCISRISRSMPRSIWACSAASVQGAWRSPSNAG